MSGFYKCQQCPQQYDGTNEHGHNLDEVCQCNHRFGQHAGGHPHKCTAYQCTCREFRPMNYKKCERCGEDIVNQPGVWVHRYNMSVKCPDGSGEIKLGGDGPGEGVKIMEELLKNATKEAKQQRQQDAAKECKNCGREVYESKIEKGEYYHKDSHNALCRVGNPEFQGSGKNQDSRAEPKGKSQGKGQGKGQGQGESEGDGKPPKPEEMPEWMLKAASDINDEWRTRIQNRDFMLTDEEAALTIHKHVDPNAAAKVREADEEAEKNLGLAVLLAFENKLKLPPAAQQALNKVVQCTKCGKKSYETTAICLVAGKHQWGVIMPTPKPQEEKQPSLDELKPEVLQHYPGNKIAAIKLVREKTGLGLKEAKDFVDKVFLDTLGPVKRLARSYDGKTIHDIEGDCIHCNAPLTIVNHQVVHAYREQINCDGTSKKAQFGGAHSLAKSLTPNELGWFWRPWDEKYTPVEGKCKHCSGLLYKGTGNVLYHCASGNRVCGEKYKPGTLAELQEVPKLEEIPF